jgi:hypothetical protein
MALVKFSDILEPAVWLKYGKEYTPEKLDIISSNVVSGLDEDLQGQMSAGGSIIDMPFWQDISRVEPNGMTDDETTSATPLKTGASEEKARKLYWHQSWSQADMAGVIATGNRADPLKAIAEFAEGYWRRVTQLTLIQVLNGVLADNVANDSADMRYRIYSDVVAGSITAANRISPAALTAARLTMGEFMDELGTIIMHSKVYGDALNQEAISFVQPSHLPFKIATFAGMSVIVSDDVTVTAGTNSPMYRSYILGPGVVTYGTSMPDIPVEVFRNPEKGNGGGVETLHNRRYALIHPKGFKYLSASGTSKSPTWANLATAANWDRVRQRKNIKLAYLETN